MTDRTTRQLEHHASTGDPDARAALLRARLRAGLVTVEQLQLWAYAGLESAEEVLSYCGICNSGPFRGHPCRCYLLSPLTLADWAAGLPALALSLKVREACERCKGTGSRLGHRPLRSCNTCDGSGTVEREIGQPHLAVTACIGVARAVLPGYCTNACALLPTWGPYVHKCLHARNAILAAERWRDDPTRENLEALGDTCRSHDLPLWCSLFGVATSHVNETAGALMRAAGHIGEDAVRLAVLRAVVTVEWRT